MNQSKSIPFAGCFETGKQDTDLYFVGICDDNQSTYLQGSADAPSVIRRSYDYRSYSSTTESGIDLVGSVHDFGDLKPGLNRETSFSSYTGTLEKFLLNKKRVFVAGGDHSITIPVVEAFKVLDTPIHYIQIDAHPDLYPSYDGSRFSHACTAARLAEMPHVASMTLVGIRTMNNIQAEVALQYGEKIQVLEAKDIREDLPQSLGIDTGIPVYLSIDMDGFDPSFAPGVSHPVPGGLSPRQIMNLFHRAEWDLVGMDVVEVNPLQDFNHLTSILAARLLHEGMGFVRKKNPVFKSLKSEGNKE